MLCDAGSLGLFVDVKLSSVTFICNLLADTNWGIGGLPLFIVLYPSISSRPQGKIAGKCNVACFFFFFFWSLGCFLVGGAFLCFSHMCEMRDCLIVGSGFPA